MHTALELINNAALASSPAVGFRIAQWNLNSFADAGNLDAMLRVNGGYNGNASRDASCATARGDLGA